MTEQEDWMSRSDSEIEGAASAWRAGNAGRGRVGARRAAGMAIKGRLSLEARADYGTTFMHHLNALADDGGVEAGVREAAWRLAARPAPEGGWQVPIARGLTPMDDAEVVRGWCREVVGEA